MVPLVADDAGLQGLARAVSTPGSPLYGQYEPVPVLAQRFGASPSVRARALAYLRAAGSGDAQVNATGMFAEATLTVAQAERAFGTQLASFASGASGATYLAPVAHGRASAAGVSVPPALRGVATGVVGLDPRRLAGGASGPAHRSGGGGRRGERTGEGRAHAAAGQPFSLVPRTGTPAGCQAAQATGGFTPNQYLDAYGYSPLRQAGLAGRGQRVALIEIDGFRYSDLRSFARCFGLRIPRLSVFYLGSRRALPPGGETTLDLEVLDSAAPGLDAIQVYENSGNAAQVIRSLALPLLVPGAKPQVVSASFGLCEPFLARSFGRAGILSLERDVELAAATGITVVSASGDQGSAGCVGQKGRPLDGLAVEYPASSPFVTGVGGTNLLLSPTNAIRGQVVWNDTRLQLAAGGGGFSGLFATPAYQKVVVSGARRVVPDVSMLADLAPGYAVYCSARDCKGRHHWRTVGGTSAAAPLLAGGVALVDQDLHRHQRQFLGFMNPLLYSIGGSPDPFAVFSDVTAFGNDVGPYIPGSGGKPLGCCSAHAGFDAASGFGSVKLTALDAVAEAVLPRTGDISVSIPRGQHPLRRRALRARVHCSLGCTAYAFALVSYGTGEISARSARQRLARRGTRILSIRFSARQRSRLRAALASGHRVEAEVFAVEIGARGEAAKVTAGRVARITS
ncbi:MAG: S53 family peptidase [Actinomycetota bacterium]|nr:S53 family peptidase [Actinomycetota bacterium]